MVSKVPDALPRDAKAHFLDRRVRGAAPGDDD